MRSSTTTPKVTYLKDYKVSDFLIEHVELTVELDVTQTLVTSKLKIKKNPEAENPSHDLVLNGEVLELRSVKLNGHTLDATQFEVAEDGLCIHNVPNEGVIEIQNTINPSTNTALRGLYVSNNTFATHNEAQGFRRITYYLDRPDVMATYTTTIIADPAMCPVMLSNGNLKEEVMLEDGRRSICWDDPIKKPSYLFALVAGNLSFIEDDFVTMSGRKVNLRIYAKENQIERCHHAMQSLKNAMKWDEENYGRECDLDSYKVVGIDDFNAGAMENKGLNIFNSVALFATPATATDDRFMRIQGTVAHEYFHNWTGDRVTVRDWFQLSLKEGLTSNRDQSYSEAMFSKAARANAVRDVRSRQFPEDAGPLAHPVQPQSYITPDNFYTATIYRKGAEIYGMLHTRLGAQAYRKAMDLYFSRYDGQAVTIDQFVATLAESSQLDLSQFMLWFQQAGTPDVVVTPEYFAEKREYVLRFKQSCQPTPGQPEKKPLPIPVSMGLLDEKGRCLPLYINGAEAAESDAVLMLTEAEQEFRFSNIDSCPVPSLFRNFSAPVKWQFNYDNEALQLLMEYDTDPFNRLEASQRYIMNHLRELIVAADNKQPLVLPRRFIDCFYKLLSSDSEDKWLLAEMLTIPSVSYIADQVEKINIDAIHEARKFMLCEVAEKLKNEFRQTYHACSQQESKLAFVGDAHQPFDPKQAASRRLKNLCLGYLMALHQEDIQQLAFAVFEASLKTNLTNTMAVFRHLNALDGKQRQSVIEQYFEAWQNESLVLMEWFATLAASAENSDVMQTLLAHPRLDIKNPNMVNAVIRGFCENVQCYHALNGEGYRLLAETILKLDAINPKMSTSQIVYLTNWRRFDDVRKEAMRAALQSLLQHAISNDLFELVSKCLGEEVLVLQQDGVPLKRIDGLFASRQVGVQGQSEDKAVEPSTGLCVML